MRGDSTPGPAPGPEGAPGKFRDPEWTADGEPRATVTLRALRTLWFNTGTLCNLSCARCYVESSPTNDRLVYLSAREVGLFLDDLDAGPWDAEEIGFTGGEPFINPELVEMLEDALGRGYRVLVLTNGMRPMMKRAGELRDLRARYGGRLLLRVSLDHYRRDLHERERGARSWEPALNGLRWLSQEGIRTHVAGRTFWDESEEELREGFARLFSARGVDVDPWDPVELVLFPEMDAGENVPEITESCWDLLGVDPGGLMCASSRIVVKRKGAERPTVQACTLLPYQEEFSLGRTLSASRRSVPLNHPHCATFCVLGGGSCGADG